MASTLNQADYNLRVREWEYLKVVSVSAVAKSN